jgi:hypothetical protein
MLVWSDDVVGSYEHPAGAMSRRVVDARASDTEADKMEEHLRLGYFE